MLVYKLNNRYYMFKLSNVVIDPFYAKCLNDIFLDKEIYIKFDSTYLSYVILDGIELLINIDIITNEMIKVEDNIIKKIIDSIYVKKLSNSLYINDGLNEIFPIINGMNIDESLEEYIRQKDIKPIKTSFDYILDYLSNIYN